MTVFAGSIHDFNQRLLGALDYPRLILPTHWDNFEKPFSQPPQDLRDVFGDNGNIDLWVQQVKAESRREPPGRLEGQVRAGCADAGPRTTALATLNTTVVIGPAGMLHGCHPGAGTTVEPAAIVRG